MAPVAVIKDDGTPASTQQANLKSKVEPVIAINPFYSPSLGDDGDTTYPFAEFKVSFLHFSLQSLLLIHRIFVPPAVLPESRLGAPDRGSRYRARTIRRSL